MRPASQALLQWSYFCQFFPTSVLNCLWEQVCQSGYGAQDGLFETYCEKTFNVFASALIPFYQTRLLTDQVMQEHIALALGQARHTYKGRSECQSFEKHACEVLLKEMELTVATLEWQRSGY